jgi:hypothetical protein
MVEDLPEAFRAPAGEMVVPWQGEPVVVSRRAAEPAKI